EPPRGGPAARAPGPARAPRAAEQADARGGHLPAEQRLDEARLGVRGPCRVGEGPAQGAGTREGVGHLVELGAELPPALPRPPEGGLPPLGRRGQCRLAARSHHASVAPPTFCPVAAARSVCASSSSRKRSMTR